jgi:Zn-dependent peptidase ImmA (M78 family)
MPEMIPVAPDVLVWARESALATTAEAAERVGQPEETIRRWEVGTERPTFSQLERLADEYGVSLNVLLLPLRPDLPEPPPDFRAPTGPIQPLSRTARRELRRARQLQHLLSEVPVLPPPSLPRSEGRAANAEAVRASLGISLADQLKWRSGDQAFGAWREALNRRGVLVLQYRLPQGEAQGWSLPSPNAGPPVIFVNQGDWINARIFTLIHELAHLLISHDGGICDPLRHGPSSSPSDLEMRCNRLAGAVLVPGQDLLSHGAARQAASTTDNEEAIELLGVLAKRYRVSSQVVWYRVRETGLVGEDRFRRLWPELRHPARKKRTSPDDSGIPRWMMASSRFGPSVVGGLLRATDAGHLEPVRMMRALGLGTGDVARLEGEPRPL